MLICLPLLLACVFAATLNIGGNDVLGIDSIYEAIVVDNGFFVIGQNSLPTCMTAPWACLVTGPLPVCYEANACQGPTPLTGIDCRGGNAVFGIETRLFFDTSPSNMFIPYQQLNLNHINFTLFENLQSLTLDSLEMVGDLSLPSAAFPSSLTSLLIDNSLDPTFAYPSLLGPYTLVGTPRSDLFANLFQLRSLTLRNISGITGPLPDLTSLASLTSLTLQNLPGIVFTLDFLSSLPLLGVLTVIDCPGLTGTLPTLPTSLRYLILRGVPALAGPLELPTAQLHYVYLADVRIVQQVPVFVPQVTTSRASFIVYNTSFTSIDASLCDALSTTSILMAHNANLSSLPSCFTTCTSLAPNGFGNDCFFYANNVCVIGQSANTDVASVARDAAMGGNFVQFYGAPSTDCKLGASGVAHPCGVSRDSAVCLDCKNVENGPAKLDRCSVCQEPNSPTIDACVDCLGVPFGSTTYDSCDVCNGFGTTCFDCAGVAAGDATLNDCGVCSNVCSLCDCAGTCRGTRRFDRCGFCSNADDAFHDSCVDCSGKPFGTLAYDVCDVCGGDGTSCRDCAGVPNGAARVDRCGRCNGQDALCDCAGVYLGFTVLDVCDVCGGDSSTCADCRGVPNGAARYDACDLCAGDGTTCAHDVVDPRRFESLRGTVVSIFVVIVGVFVAACLVAIVIFSYVARRRRQDAAPVQARNNGGNVGRGAAGFLVTLLALTSSGAHAVLPGTTNFIRLMAQRTTLRINYPSWFAANGSALPYCTPSMVGVTCFAQDIVALNLVLPIQGEFFPGDSLLGQLPLLTSLTIRNSPNLRFPLDGVGNAPGLRLLELIAVGVKGVLPNDIALCTALTAIDIEQTQLSDSLGHNIDTLVNLRSLTIRRSRLGAIGTPRFAALRALTSLDLSSNVIVGSIPASINQLPALRSLHLENNRLSGGMPVHDIASLTDLNVANNLLTSSPHPGGAIIAGLTSAPAYAGGLRVLVLARNSFGTVLPDLTGFSSLYHVDLSHNAFSRSAAKVGAGLFRLGETGARIVEFFATDNLFTDLDGFTTGNPFVGSCDFRRNNLCTSFSNIAPVYYQDNCTLGVREACGTCGDFSCYDCRGVKHGSATYDACDVCGGRNDTCRDCLGVPSGPHTRNACGQCAIIGDAECPHDCAGTLLGTLLYDACDVCGGDGSTCADCRGVPGGSATYDACGDCANRDARCVDCLGVVNGTAAFNDCGVCLSEGNVCESALMHDLREHANAYAQFVGLAVALALAIVVLGVLVFLAFFF